MRRSRWCAKASRSSGELHDKFAFVYALVPLAAAAVLKGDDAWAARILGARDAVTERTGVTVVDKSVHDLREQAEREVRARLGPDRWARAYAAGRGTSIDALLKDIDRILGNAKVSSQRQEHSALRAAAGSASRTRPPPALFSQCWNIRAHPAI